MSSCFCRRSASFMARIVDVVLVDEHMAGFIKSAADSLDRFPHQVRAYSAVFDFATAVVAPNHLRRNPRAPPGLVGCDPGRIQNREYRADSPARARAESLSRSSSVGRTLVEARGRSDTRDAHGRAHAEPSYGILADTFSWDELRGKVSKAIRLREDWLPAYSPGTGGDSCPPGANSRRCRSSVALFP